MVVSGKDKGKTGKIERVLASEGRLVIEGIALKKRHIKGVSGQSGHIVESPRAIDASNVMFMDPDKKLPTRVGRENRDNGRVRVAKKSGKVL